MASVKVTGFKELEMKLKRNADMQEVKKIVKEHGANLQKKAQRNAPIGTPESTGIPGYKGGTLRGSLGLEIADEGLSAEVEATADYSAYVELGTRFMQAQPYLGPAFNEQKEKFKKDMKNLVR